jgi:hypothetical protein
MANWASSDVGDATWWALSGFDESALYIGWSKGDLAFP